MKKSYKKNVWFSGPYLIWSIGFIVLPLLTVIKYAFTSKDGGFTFDNITTALTDTANLKALGITITLALLATVICFFISCPIAIRLSKLSLSKRNALIFLFILPMWMNFMLQMVAINVIIEENGIINSILTYLNLPKINVANSFTAVLIGMAYDYFPFMLLPIFNTISNIDNNLINASKDLGAGGFLTLFRVILPLAMPGIISGATMVFIPAISDFAIAEMLGGGKIMLIGNVIEMRFTKGQYYQGSGLALMLTIFVLVTSVLTGGAEDGKEGVSLI